MASGGGERAVVLEFKPTSPEDRASRPSPAAVRLRNVRLQDLTDVRSKCSRLCAREATEVIERSLLEAQREKRRVREERRPAGTRATPAALCLLSGSCHDFD